MKQEKEKGNYSFFLLSLLKGNSLLLLCCIRLILPPVGGKEDEVVTQDQGTHILGWQGCSLLQKNYTGMPPKSC